MIPRSICELSCLPTFRSTHNKPEWFMPLSSAIAGLTPEQAKWVPINSSGKVNPNANHSVGMIAKHILFWNANALAQLKGEPTTNPSTKDETFNDFNPARWDKTVLDLEAVMASLEKLVQQADPATLLRIYTQFQPCTTSYETHPSLARNHLLFINRSCTNTRSSAPLPAPFFKPPYRKCVGAIPPTSAPFVRMGVDFGFGTFR
jgi:hypothetical protein